MLKENGRYVERRGFAVILAFSGRVLMAAASLCVLLAVWQHTAERVGAFILPEPLAVGRCALNLLHTHFYDTILLSLRSGLTGTLTAIILGVSLGWIAGFFPAFCALVRPWNTVLLGTPPIIWVVMAFFRFGTNTERVIMFTVVMTIFPLLFAAGVMSIATRPASLHEMAAAYRLSWGKRLRHLYLPHMAMTLMPALIVATGMGIKVTVMAELLASDHGIGAAISSARDTLEVTEMMAYVLITVLIILSLEYGLLQPVRRFLLPGERHGENNSG